MNENGMVYFARKGDENGLGEKLYLNPAMANRHGFICGATGTGKSVTLKVLAESFSAMGVPTFFSDVKGDMAGIAMPGDDNENMQARLDRFEIRDQFEYRGFPVSIYDIYGERGIPLRTTVSEMGPQLMSQILELNETQQDLLMVTYKIADDQQMLLYDTKDLKSMLTYVADHAEEYKEDYGYIAPTSMATIVRAIVALESEGADRFFGEPAININDFFCTDANGYGMVNILASETLINRPRTYSAFMLYLLSELFEVLPEVGNPDKPKMVFFFDEAHLLFNNASKSLLEKIEQVVKLIRSKGVGIFFVTQSPGDIPNGVMSQLGNKIEHGLHAYTPAEQKVVKAAADSFRANPEFDTAELLQNLGTGEAVVSVLDEKGAPGVAEHAYILPPFSRMGAITDEERNGFVLGSPLYAHYSTRVDSDSAYEIIQRIKMQPESGAIPEVAAAPSVIAEPVAADVAAGAPDVAAQTVVPEAPVAPAAPEVTAQPAVSEIPVAAAPEVAVQPVAAPEVPVAPAPQPAAPTPQAPAAPTPSPTAAPDVPPVQAAPQQAIPAGMSPAEYQAAQQAAAKAAEAEAKAAAKAAEAERKAAEKAAAEQAKLEAKLAAQAEKEALKKQREVDRMKNSVMRTTGGSIGREVGKMVGEAVLGKKGRTIGGNIGASIGRNILGTISKLR